MKTIEAIELSRTAYNVTAFFKGLRIEGGKRMRGLLIAEKPSVMRAISAVYNSLPKGADTLDFAAFHGHLMQLKAPQEVSADWGNPWTAEQLPMIPAAFEYKAVDKPSAEALCKKIKEGKYDYLVNACDAGREGEHIFWSFYESYALKLPVKRYWASSNTKPAIKAALGSLLPASKFDGMRKAAKLRAQLDWLVGMNFSRAISVSTKTHGYVGRVMSPVRKMVVDRELEIRNFKAETFWELKATYCTTKGEEFATTRLLPPDHKETRHTSKADAETVRAALKSQGKVVRVKQTDRSVNAPTLYSQTELQKAANKTYKMSPDKTLSIAQKLYEDGFITYPRTESRYLPTDMIPEIPAHLKVLYKIPDIGPFAQKITNADIKRATTGKIYVDDGRIEDHHAIVPTDQEVEWTNLSADEQKIYKLIARQFVAIFLPPYRAKTTSVLVQNGRALFRCDGTVEVDRGYTVLAPAKKSKDVVLPDLKEGEMVALKGTKITQGTTKPPLRYTPDTLLTAMQNAGRFVSDAKQRSILKEAAGLGTAATRAPILKKMVESGDIRMENNSYVPSEYSIGFIQNYGDRDFCSPAMTASWEEKLRAMESEKGYPGDLAAEISDYISREVKELLTLHVDLKAYMFTTVGKCPKCGRNVLSKKSYFVCENYKGEQDPCDFFIPKSFLGATINEKEAVKLLDGGETEPKTLTKKDNSTFQAALCINRETRTLGFAFGGSGEKSKGLGPCPICGKGIVREGRDFYICSRRSEGCTYVQRREVRDAKLTPKDMSTLLSGKTTRFFDFTWSSGRQGKAAFRLKSDGKLEWVFAS